jgi:hypothetical protein
MENQSLFNIGVVSILACIAWFAKELWNKAQRHDERMNKLEVDLPTKYVSKADIDSRFDKLEAKLDMLFERIDRKADK